MSAATAAQPAHKTDAVVVLISYLSFVVLGMPGAMLGIAWSQKEWSSIQTTFGLELGAVFALYITSTLGYSTASFISGRLFARYRPSLVFTGGTLITAVGLVGYVLAPPPSGWLVMVACGLLVGFGGGLVDGGMNIYFAAFFGPRLMNWLHACFGVGLALGVVVVTVILSSGGSWQTGYLLVGGLYLLMGVVFFLSRDRWFQVVGSESAAKTDIPAAATLRLPVVWVGIGIFVAYAGLEAVPNQWLSPLFNQARGIEAQTAATWVGIYLASFTIGRIFFGVIVTQFNPVTLIRVCVVVMIVMTIGLTLNPIPNLGVVWVTVYGFVVAPIFALLITNTQERLGAAHAANAIGFYVAAASAGFGILPGVAGLLAERTSLEIVPPFMLVLAILLAVLYGVTSSPRLRRALMRGAGLA